MDWIIFLRILNGAIVKIKFKKIEIMNMLLLNCKNNNGSRINDNNFSKWI
jgi:hypothetical protein